MDFTPVLNRVKRILMDPETEWGVIARERTTVTALYTNYVVVLAAIPAVFGFVKITLIGVDLPLLGVYRVSLGAGVAGTLIGYTLSIAQVYILALIVDALAPTFGAHKDPLQAQKTAVYASTAVWIAGFGQLLPMVGVLIALVGAAYSVYLLYKALPRTMRCEPDTTIAFTAVSTIAAVILSVLVGQVVATVTGTGGSMGPTQGSETIRFDKDSPLSNINGHTQQLEGAKDAAAAQQPGDAPP